MPWVMIMHPMLHEGSLSWTWQFRSTCCFDGSMADKFMELFYGGGDHWALEKKNGAIAASGGWLQNEYHKLPSDRTSKLMRNLCRTTRWVAALIGKTSKLHNFRLCSTCTAAASRVCGAYGPLGGKVNGQIKKNQVCWKYCTYVHQEYKLQITPGQRCNNVCQWF